ncbi:hypothetical protein J437_LFUL002176 [Ladona fulva]|uniref:Uncharacterized protein n=1 Tax=Ladona fulva TaxID=123851 RepID=A0A8K0NUI8_LADFU|nr:hypothetical protein J437_LFUL002176 [Ladona fulva]
MKVSLVYLSSELRSSTGDSSMPECDCKESTERSCSTDSGECYLDCHFCHRMHTQSQPTSSKESGADMTAKRQQQADQRPKWGANRPSCKYTTQSEKDPRFSNRSPTPRNKRNAGKKSSEKAAESKKSDNQKGAQISQPPLPALAPPKKDTPRRVQIVKPSLSLDQDSNGYAEHLYPDPSGSRTQLTYLPTTQLSPSALQSEMKHLFPPVLPVIQQGCLSPIRISQSPMPPLRINSSPLPSRLSSTSMPPLAASQSPICSSRQTPIPTSPSPPLQKPPKSNRQCSSPPVPAVLAKIRREQKSPPRQSSFISSAPDREERVVTSRRESRSGTPSVKPPTPGPSTSNPRPKSESAILLISPRDPGSAVLMKPLSPVDLESKNSTLLIPAQNEVSVSPVVNISYPSSSSPGEDALMLVTLSEDISIGSPSPNPLSSVLEIDDKSSYLLVSPSDEISLGFDCRSNFSVSRASQVSADLMPERFWEDFGSSANMLTPYPEGNSAMSTMEEHSSISKAEDIHPDKNLPDNVVKTDEKSSNIDKSEGVDSEKVIKIGFMARNEESKERESKCDSIESKKLEGDEKEVKLDLLESRDKMKDKETISHAEIHEDEETLEDKSEDAMKLKEENVVNVESNEQKPEDNLETNSACLADPPSVSNADEAVNQADVEEVRSKVDSDVKETNARDSSIHSTDKDEQSKVKELKEMKKEESSTSIKDNKEFSEVDPEVRPEAKNKLEEQELPAEERKDHASEKEVLDEKNEKEKK